MKWECSGILDDGTGQAKLYAERDAAIRFLLGSRGGGGGGGGSGAMSDGQRRAIIEQGAWLVPGGIVFSKTTPPKSWLKNAVRAARTAAAASHQRRWQYQVTTRHCSSTSSSTSSRMTEDDVLRHMTATARAEYLMEWTCRCPSTIPLSPQQQQPPPDRRRLYLVRCKPLADAVVHVGQTDVQLANHHDGIFTYTLPPLQLALVDCAHDEPGHH
jgi:hypothetical protein